jgi:prevent-host-death family protein
VTTRVKVADVRDNLPALLERVKRGEQAEIVGADGEALAVVISVEAFRRFQQAADRDFFEIVAEIHERNRDTDPDEVMRDVTTAVEEVRRERRGQSR